MLNTEAAAEPVSASSGRIAPFGKYLLLQRVSVGGMAEVFKALPANAKRIDQIVAIKRILPNIAEDSEFIGMFIDEARIAGQLTHPNICRIYELGRVNNDHYIAMQFLWGRDLLKVMNRFKKAGRFVSPIMAAFVAAKALAALHYAHTKCDEHGQPLHIIHRDVSPQNIIVGYSGQVKLIDFGVARAASQSQKTQAGILKGKFGYMSPEMIRGLPIDHRSDVFAMGICMHELLTSSRLFYGESDFATLELVRDARVVPPSHKAAGVPPELDAIVLKALSRDADDRYQSAEEMQQALEQFLAQQAPQYGQAEVGVAMRQAFHTEVQRERDRLELFWGMLERGELVRGASVPALPAASGESQGREGAESGEGREDAESGERRASPVGALLEASEGPEVAPLDPTDGAPFAAQGGEDEELQDEQTQIFFSASEVGELREIASSAEPGPRTLSDMVPPPPPDYERLSLHTFASSGTYQRAASAPSASIFDQPYVNPEQAYEPLDPPSSRFAPPPEPRVSGALRYTLLVFAAAALALAAYVLPRLADAHTGALQVAATGDPDALVRVDGIVRGNPPLVVEGLTEGLHELEIEATGYELARTQVRVEKGRVLPVELPLTRAAAQPSVAGLDVLGTTKDPADRAPEITSLAAPAKAATKPRAVSKPVKAEGETPADVLDPNSPTVEESSGSETQVADGVNPDLIASNEGELLISTVPWSHVFVDDADTGRDTPVRALRVAAGPHRIGLRTPDNVMHQVDVVVEAGRVVRIIRRF